MTHAARKSDRPSPPPLAAAGWVAGLVMAGLPSSAGAADGARVKISAGTRVEASDNVATRSDGGAQGGLTATQFGTADVTVDNRRLNLTFDYGVDFDTTMDRTDSERVRQTMLGVGRGELIENTLFLDARIERAQALIDATGQVPASLSGNRGNLTTEQFIELSPSLVHQFGNLAEAELRYRYRGAFISDPDIGDSQAHEERLQVRSGHAWTEVSLTGTFDHLRISATQPTGNLETYTDQIDAQYALSRRFSLLAGIGLERIDQGLDVDQPFDPIWNVGFKARPGPLSEVRFTYGQRYGGPNINALLTYQISPRLKLNAGYQDTLESGPQNSQFGRLARAVGTAPASQAGQEGLAPQPGQVFDPVNGQPVTLTNPGLGVRPDVELVHRFDGSLTATFPRSGASLTLTDERRESQALPDLHVTDVAGTYVRQLSPYTNLNLGLDFRHASEGGGFGSSDSLIESLSLTFSLTDDLVATTGLTRVDRLDGRSSRNPSEDMVFAQLQIRF